MITILDESLRVVAKELVPHLYCFFEKKYPNKNWWKNCVIDKLTFSQKQFVSNKNITDLFGLDLPSLLRLYDKHFDDLSQFNNLDLHSRTLCRFVTQIRNDVAHASSIKEPFSIEEYYRFFDILYLFLFDIKANKESLDYIYDNRSIALERLYNITFKPSNSVKSIEVDNSEDEEFSDSSRTVGSFYIDGPLETIQTKISDFQTKKPVPATSIPWKVTDNKNVELTIHLNFLDDPGDGNAIGQIYCVSRNNSSALWDQIVNRLRIGIYVLDEDHLYMQLKTVVKKRNKQAGRKNLPIVDIASKVGLDIQKLLMDSGAKSLGTQGEIGGPMNRQKNITSISFRKDDLYIPVIAYVITSILSVK
jgi:hypothetical protein